MRLGAELQLHLLPRASFDPWVGLGFGYELLHVATSVTLPLVGTTTSESNFHGVEFAQAQLGGDVRVGRQVGVGLFVAMSVAEFVSVDSKLNGGSSSGEISKKAVHGWVMFGARVVLNP